MEENFFKKIQGKLNIGVAIGAFTLASVLPSQNLEANNVQKDNSINQETEQLMMLQQTDPIFSNPPEKSTLLEFFKRNSEKDKVCRAYLINTVNELTGLTLPIDTNSVNWIFDNLSEEEVYLKEGEYLNSGYDKTTKKVNPSNGHKWEGFAWVLYYKDISFPLIKGNCGNILKIKKVYKTLTPESKKDSITYKTVVDTISYKIPTVENTERNVVNYTPAGKSSFPAYGEDGFNVWNWTPSGWTCQQSLSGGLNVNAHTQGGSSTSQNISGGLNINNITIGGYTIPTGLSVDDNVISITDGGVYNGCRKLIITKKVAVKVPVNNNK